MAKRPSSRSVAADEDGRNVHGSAYDQAAKRRTPRKRSRVVKSWFSGWIVSLVALVVPTLYMAYCWFVWKTSKITDGLTPTLEAGLERHGRFVCVLWHQEVFTVAYAYRHIHPHTLASTGNFGQIITRMLERCNFTVFRGGSSRGSARRRRVAVDMIRHMRTEPRVPYGITVDGSHGPPFVMKSGGAVIARACNAPIFVTRGWYSRKASLNTWDRTGIPLPFGHIWMEAVGPYWIDPEGGKEELEAACAHLQAELEDLAHVSLRVTDGDAYGEVPDGFPPDWTPRWQPGVLGLKRTRWDLDPDNPPPWAHLIGDPRASDAS